VGEILPVHYVLEKDENLPIIKKTKHPTKGEKKVQDGRTQVLANEESSKEGGLLQEQEQTKYPKREREREKGESVNPISL